MKPYSSRFTSKDFKRSPDDSKIKLHPLTSMSFDTQSNRSGRKVNSYSNVMQELKLSLNETNNKSQISTVIETSPHKRKSTKSDNMILKQIEDSKVNLDFTKKKKKVSFKKKGEFVKIINIESFKKYYYDDKLSDTEKEKREKISCKCLML